MRPRPPGLHTQGDSLEEATDNAREALHLYVDGLREEGRPIETGVVRRKLPLPSVTPRLSVVSGAQLIRALERLGGKSSDNEAAACASATPTAEHSSSCRSTRNSCAEPCIRGTPTEVTLTRQDGTPDDCALSLLDSPNADDPRHAPWSARHPTRGAMHTLHSAPLTIGAWRTRLQRRRRH